MEQLLSLLNEKGLTLGSIESMTGGLFASTVTSIPGASKSYKGSIVSYSSKVKEQLLGIDANLIKEKDVVSKEVAYEMAKSGKKLLDVDVCISITGNAGPTSEPGKEGVGVTYIGVAYKSDVKVFRELFAGERNQIRQKAILSMKEHIIEIIEE